MQVSKRIAMTGGLGPQLPSATAFQRIDPVFSAKLGDMTLELFGPTGSYLGELQTDFDSQD